MQRFSKLAVLAIALVAAVFHARTCALETHNGGDIVAEVNPDEAFINYDAATRWIWSSRVRAGFGFLRRIDKAATKEFERAWMVSGVGTNGREGVVLIFRMGDGSYKVQSQGYTNEYQRFRFKWSPAAVAIVHTHPNSCDPRPSEQDQRVAEEYDAPIFTITSSGMYAYDPATKFTIQVLDGLDWLKPSKWTPDVYRNLMASFFGEHNHRPRYARRLSGQLMRRASIGLAL